MAEIAMNELRAAAAVAERRSFRAAAGELGVSPSGLSHSVATLEARMGVRLFQRTTRSVTLTPAGHKFLDRVRPALRAISEALDDVNEHRDTPAGALRITASELAAQRASGAFLSFLARYPDMAIEIVVEGRLVDIVADGFDAGVRLAEAVPQDMIAIPIAPEQRHIVVAAPSYLHGRTQLRTPADLADHACIRTRLPGGTILRWEFERRGETLKLDAPGRLTVNNYHLMLDAVLSGAGIAYVIDWLARDALADGRLVQVLNDWTPPYPGPCLYYPRHRHMTAGLRALIDHLRVSHRS